jgi:hypothetical protein
MSAVRTKVLALAGLAATLIMGAATLAQAAPAAAAPAPSTVVAGYANVPSFVPLNQGFVPVNPGDVHTTSGQGVGVLHIQTGFYQVKFFGLGISGQQFNTPLPGVVHAHTIFGDSCQPVTEPLADGLRAMLVNVKCFDHFAKPADSNFTVNYTRGGTDQGTLDTVRVSQADVLKVVTQGGVVPAAQQSSIPNAAIVVTRNPTEGTGIYRFALPRKPGSRPHALEISPTGQSADTICTITEAKPDATGDNELVRVVCRAGDPTKAVETALSVSYGEDTGTLGLASESYAYLTPPSFSTTTDCSVPGPIQPVPSTLQRNVVGGFAAGVTFQRLCVGHYVIRMDNQQLQLTKSGNGSVLAFNADRRCPIVDDFTPAGATFRQVRIVCQDQFGQLKDGLFQFNYTARQF